MSRDRHSSPTRCWNPANWASMVKATNTAAALRHKSRCWSVWCRSSNQWVTVLVKCWLKGHKWKSMTSAHAPAGQLADSTYHSKETSNGHPRVACSVWIWSTQSPTTDQLSSCEYTLQHCQAPQTRLRSLALQPMSSPTQVGQVRHSAHRRRQRTGRS